MTIEFYDTFTRTEASGLGVSDSGHTWTADSDFSVNGTSGVISVPATNSTQQALLSGVNESDVDLLQSFMLTEYPAGDSLVIESIARHSGGTFTLGKVSISPDGTASVNIHNSGDSSSSTPIEDWTGESQVNLRFRMVGNSMKIKAWFGEGVEPANWSLAKLVTSTNASGTVGFQITLGSSSTSGLPYIVHVDDAVYSSASPLPSVVDAFTRTVSNSLGISDSDHTWVVADGNTTKLSTNGTEGVATLIDDGAHVVVTAGESVLDYLMEAQFTVPVATASAIFYGGLVSRWENSSNFLWHYLRFASGGNLQLVTQKVVGGVVTDLATFVVAASWTAGNTYTIKAEVTGNQIKSKAWLSSTTEPTNWSSTVTDAAIPGEGPLGIRFLRSVAGGSSGAEIRVDSLSFRNVFPEITVELFDSIESPGVKITLTNGDVYHAIRIERVHVDNLFEPAVVRGFDTVDVPSSLASVIDYEMPLDETFIYRVDTLDANDAVVSSNNSEPIIIEVPYHRVIVRSVGTPSLSRRIQITEFPGFSEQLRVLQEAKVLHRRRPVVLFDVMESMTGDFSCMATLDQDDPIGWNIRELIREGQPLMFQSVSRITGVPDFYFVAEGVRALRKETIHPDRPPRYIYEIDFREVDKPATEASALGFFEWETLVEAGHTDWQSVKDTFSTWLAVLNFTSREPL